MSSNGLVSFFIIAPPFRRFVIGSGVVAMMKFFFFRIRLTSHIIGERVEMELNTT